jgi:hypothetical protein
MASQRSAADSRCGLNSAQHPKAVDAALTLADQSIREGGSFCGWSRRWSSDCPDPEIERRLVDRVIQMAGTRFGVEGSWYCTSIATHCN